jgi:hypothetical protein
VIIAIIVTSVVKAIGNTGMRNGFITIETNENEYVKLDVGSYTSFETLDEGATVCVEADSLGTTGTLYAQKVTLIQ